MTQRKTPSSPAPAQSPTGYWRVTVGRPVPDVFGETFGPNAVYEVSGKVLEALGDAVATKEPLAPVVGAG